MFDIFLKDNGINTFDIDLSGSAGSGNIKSVSGVVFANIKSISGINKANIKRIGGITAIIFLVLGFSLYYLLLGNVENYNRFVDSTRGFSFEYPEDFGRVDIERDNGVKRIVVAPRGQEEIFIGLTLYEHDGSSRINKNVILEHINATNIENFREVELSGAPEAVRFRRIDENRGIATREVWFTHKYKYLYRVSAPLEVDPEVIDNLISSWKFESEEM